jgi:carbon-monoxide dehydrogenase large subunit
MVVAETVHAAMDAAERVEVHYQPLPSVASARSAVEAGAPALYDDLANVCIDADAGDLAATAEAFARAAYVVRLKTWVQRVTGVPMEPRSAVACYDSASGRYWLHAGSGGIVRQKQELARILQVPTAAVRVTANEIGGNFGTRNGFFPEFALVAWASKRIGRPVKWTCTRQEAFLSDYQGRDLFVEAELALAADGHFLALRASNLSNIGAHSVSYVPLTKGVGLMTSVYQVPVAHIHARAVLSNTAPTNPYRSAGRPEAMFVIERLIAIAARRHNFDQVELRRRNLVPVSAMPYANPLGLTYDSGAYEQAMDQALALADWNGFAQRRRRAARHGRLRGAVDIVKYTAVDDVGRAVNPLIVHGQSHGGIAQGVGQALLEQCVYESASGQLLSASFMDYAMPRADTLPFLVTAISEVPSPTHRLGIRGGGEGGTTPALAVVVNAIVDALGDYGVEHLEMPVTPERIWRAIEAGKVSRRKANY